MHHEMNVAVADTPVQLSGMLTGSEQGDFDGVAYLANLPRLRR
jgi:hypothetical protein